MDEAVTTGEAMRVRRVTIVNQRGLHARAAAKLAKLAASFEAEILVGRDDTTVTASSIMGLMMLAAGPGVELDLKARGPAAEEALEALGALIAQKFGEDV
ncbi:MAG: HPr family phosphocarrier protein [Kiloniellales bacterium]|nr:HPr family phosphocarrier protein [Kiloniellales bacterium]